jgi:CubicO group peptidase (beta-lactamase class C family)
MLSTTEDLVRFGNALLPDSPTPLLRPETREMLFTPLTRATPPIFGYALGWMTMRDVDLRRVYMHFGAGSGATAWFGIFPDQRVVVAALANLGHAGFTYASTVGIGSRFARQPLSPAALVTAVAFTGFYVATLAIEKLIQFVRRRQPT